MVSSVPLILYLLGRRDEGKVRRDWELLLTPRGEGVYRRIEARVQAEMQLADLTCDEPFTFRELGSIDEAKHLLDVGYTVIAKFSPNFLKMLAAMATFSRMVSAMAPMAPLRPQGFRLAQLARLASWNELLHRFLVTAGERYRLRLYILGRSLAVATRFLLDSNQRPHSRPCWPSRSCRSTSSDSGKETSRLRLRRLVEHRHESLAERRIGIVL